MGGRPGGEEIATLAGFPGPAIVGAAVNGALIGWWVGSFSELPRGVDEGAVGSPEAAPHQGQGAGAGKEIGGAGTEATGGPGGEEEVRGAPRRRKSFPS